MSTTWLSATHSNYLLLLHTKTTDISRHHHMTTKHMPQSYKCFPSCSVF